jgi:hypothetical protein
VYAVDAAARGEAAAREGLPDPWIARVKPACYVPRAGSHVLGLQVFECAAQVVRYPTLSLLAEAPQLCVPIHYSRVDTAPGFAISSSESQGEQPCSHAARTPREGSSQLLDLELAKLASLCLLALTSCPRLHCASTNRARRYTLVTPSHPFELRLHP